MAGPPLSRRWFLVAGTAAAVTTACRGSSTSVPAPGPFPATDTPAPTTPPPRALSPTDHGSAPTEAPAPGSPPTEPSPTEPSEPATTTPAGYRGADDPFTLGVASGDPDDSSVVHWTRLAPLSGLDEDEVGITLEVFADEALAMIVSTQAIVTRAAHGHSVHALTTGLAPDTWYWYRFTAGEFTSSVGRSRTTPATGASSSRLVVASASCQNYEDGFYAAHRDIAAAGVDLVFWLGDYIYEGASGVLGVDGAVRVYGTAEPTTVEEYRRRWATYKSDPDLQAAHAACPWLVVWDDHEVENNYAGDIAQDDTLLGERRAAAYQVWWEHTPTRLDDPSGTDAVIYRAFTWGDLLDASFLDTRQYRTDQACGDVTLSTDPPCPATFDPERTMLGREQREWLLNRLGAAGATWNVLAQQVIMGNFTLNGAVLNYDQWDGYPGERDALFQHVADTGVDNFVVLTGDIHFGGVGNLRSPDRRRVIGTEFVATSIASSGNVDPELTELVKSIGDVVDAELAHRGWIRHTITPDTWSAEYRTVDDVTRADSPVSVYRTFTVTAGNPGVPVAA